MNSLSRCPLCPSRFQFSDPCRPPSGSTRPTSQMGRSASQRVNAPRRGEQRVQRFHYHHTLAEPPKNSGFQSAGFGSGSYDGRLTFQNCLRSLWARIEDIRGLWSSEKTVYDTFYATREPICEPKAFSTTGDGYDYDLSR